MYPFSYNEIANATGNFEAKKNLNILLTYGSYPEAFIRKENAESILMELVNSYLLKDILIWANIKKSDKLINLLKLLAYQIGNLISINELAGQLGLDFLTVEKYIDLLEKSFILFRLPSYSANLRNELKKSRKIYFFDIGVRNAVIQDFTPFDVRNDKGQIWENFVVAEMVKNASNRDRNSSFYFWRNKNNAEIDLLEMKNKVIKAYEIKLTDKACKIPASFSAYHPETFQVIHQGNFESFLIA